MEHQIKFSHKYPKLCAMMGDSFLTHAKLLDVIAVDLNDLSSEFLNYDTGNGMYVFPPKKDNPMNVLIFRSEATGVVFTTIRPRTSTDYYRDGIGKMFKILIQGRDYE